MPRMGINFCAYLNRFTQLTCLGVLLIITGTGKPLHSNNTLSLAQNSSESPYLRSGKNILKDLSTVDAFAFDPSKGEKGKISYTLTEPARVRIVVTARGDPDQLYTILLWDWQEAGTHEVIWDGKDQCGNLVLNPLKCSISMWAAPKSTYWPGTLKIGFLTTHQLIHGHQGPHDHNKCDPSKCKPAELKITSIVPESSSVILQESGLPPADILSGKILIKAEVSEKARGYGDQTGYGIRWMIDGNLITEQYYEKESNGKCQLELDTTAFGDDEHVISVSVCDHYDHTGYHSEKVVFKNNIRRVQKR